MLRIVSTPFNVAFSRSGGSLITARIDVWEAQENQWKHMKEIVFSDLSKAIESLSVTLPRGSYSCIFQCYVEESLNGKYRFLLSIDGAQTFGDDGDVNTTSASNDSKVYKDQFFLTVS